MGTDISSAQESQYTHTSREMLEGLVRYATEETKRLHHSSVTPLHLLLALFALQKGDALKILADQGIELEAFHKEVENALGSGSMPEDAPVSFDPRTVQVLEGVGPEAALLGHPYLATEHVLLSLLRDEQGLPARLLAQHRVERDTVQQQAAHVGLTHGLPVPDTLPKGPAPRFTERAMYVLRGAQEKACSMRNDQVGTEHILMALVAGVEDIGTLILGSLGVEPSQVNAQLDLFVAPGRATHSITEMNFSISAKQAIELATEEAKLLGHPQVGTEHLLLGLIREERSVAARALHNLNVRLDFAREKVKTFPRYTQPRGLR